MISEIYKFCIDNTIRQRSIILTTFFNGATNNVTKNNFINKNYILAIIQISLVSLLLISVSRSVLARECPYSNFMVVDGKCVNLDPQMKTNKPSKSSKNTNPLSELDELTGSTIATYGSLLSLIGGTVAGYKFLVRK